MGAKNQRGQQNQMNSSLPFINSANSFLQTNSEYDFVNVNFQWSHGGYKVFLSGSFINWQYKFELFKQSLNEYSIILKLPKGVFQYKFIVDGEWRFLPDEPTEYDEKGNINNVIDTNKNHKMIQGIRHFNPFSNQQTTSINSINSSNFQFPFSQLQELQDDECQNLPINKDVVQLANQSLHQLYTQQQNQHLYQQFINKSTSESIDVSKTNSLSIGQQQQQQQQYYTMQSFDNKQQQQLINQQHTTCDEVIYNKPNNIKQFNKPNFNQIISHENSKNSKNNTHYEKKVKIQLENFEENTKSQSSNTPKSTGKKKLSTMEFDELAPIIPPHLLKSRMHNKMERQNYDIYTQNYQQINNQFDIEKFIQQDDNEMEIEENLQYKGENQKQDTDDALMKIFQNDRFLPIPDHYGINENIDKEYPDTLVNSITMRYQAKYTTYKFYQKK